ncbi:jerky protein homolog [Procambarus clarkii]|uniref:jerky protein homolog n=1 Tax=Procambarus clarkii TaxID=6728 RepID=UPI003742AD47
MKQCTIEKLLVVHMLSVEEAVWEWYRQTRDESKKPVPGLLIKEKAKHFHQEMRLHNNCAYSDGRLRGFKVRHGIRHLKLRDEKQSADAKGAEKCVSKFQIVQDDSLSPKQIYNADEISLYWCTLDDCTFTHQDERGCSTRFKTNKERLSLLVCANAAGTLKLSHFVPEMKNHFKSIGLLENNKVVLFLDNSSTHPYEDELVKGNTVCLEYFCHPT